MGSGQESMKSPSQRALSPSRSLVGSSSSSAAGSVMGVLASYSLPCGVYTAVFAALGLATMTMVTPAESPRMSGGLGLGGRGGFLG